MSGYTGYYWKREETLTETRIYRIWYDSTDIAKPHFRELFNSIPKDHNYFTHRLFSSVI